MSVFWQLPEPANFVRNVVEDLRAGYNVVLAIPDHAPPGWAAALRTATSASGLPRLQGIQPDGSPPISDLHKALSLGACSARATVSDLCDEPGFRGRLLHVQQFTPDAWPAWSNFLLQYEDTCRHLELAERTLFIVTLSGDLAISAPAPANLLRVHRWLARMDGLNAQLHAANLLAGRTQSIWQRQLTVALLGELALWDPEVITIGTSLRLAEILAPTPWLEQIAAARGWSVTDNLKSPTAEWRGIRQPFEGRHRTHSAWLAAASRKEALAQRVWNGQVSALFPLLERHRRSLLHCYRGLLRVPWPTQFGKISSMADLELSHIADQLKIQGSGGLRDVYDFVSWLRDIRNDLAHLSCVAPQRLLEPRFQSRMDQFLTNDND